MHIGYLTLHLPSRRFTLGYTPPKSFRTYTSGVVSTLSKPFAPIARHFHRFDVARLDSRADACEWEAAVIMPEVVATLMSFNLIVGGGRCKCFVVVHRYTHWRLDPEKDAQRNLYFSRRQHSPHMELDAKEQIKKFLASLKSSTPKRR